MALKLFGFSFGKKDIVPVLGFKLKKVQKRSVTVFLMMLMMKKLLMMMFMMMKKCVFDEVRKTSKKGQKSIKIKKKRKKKGKLKKVNCRVSIGPPSKNPDKCIDWVF